MFFIGLTVCLISLLAGVLMLTEGDHFYGVGLIGVGLVLGILLSYYYKSKKKKQEAGVSDCTEAFDCRALSDCDCNP